MSKRVAETSTQSSRTVTRRADTIVVNRCQDGNPILEHLQNVTWNFGDIVPDFELGRTTCALFLSIRYHKLHPNYLYERLKALGKLYTLRVLLVLVDQDYPEKPLRELTRVSLLLNFCIVLAWSEEEAARYMETFKLYEHRSADSIRERQSQNIIQRANSVLTSIRTINKTDAINLITNFRSIREIVLAEKGDLELIAGFGQTKINEFLATMNDPFFMPS